MAKNIIVNGEQHDGISAIRVLLATGGKTLFRDADEMSGGVDGIVEIAAGSFSVSVATSGYTIKHGMSVAPDVVAIIPKYFYDTTDNNFAILVASQHAGATGGRRAIDGATTHFQGALNENDISTEITVATSSLAKLQPTYTDVDGNTGTQVYLWVAVKFAE